MFFRAFTLKNSTALFKVIKSSLIQSARKCIMPLSRNVVSPPDSVRGMTVLDKSKFSVSLTIPTLNIKDLNMSKVLPHVKNYVFKMRHLKPVQKVKDDEENMLVLLNPNAINEWTDFKDSDRLELERLSLSESDLKNEEIVVTYDNFQTEDIFRSVLPGDQEGFSSFSQIGHIVHVNLRDHLLPYRFLIAQVLFDKVPNVRSVVNKVDMIDNTYRNFKMELLYGEDDTVVKIKENRCEFHFDFATVYWNPRLSTEHERIVEMLNGKDVLFDVFAGVGPFAIPAAKKGCTVYANDLNPESFKWLEHNAKINKIKVEKFKAYNKDGRDFILTDLKRHLIEHLCLECNVHITMNLPALAITFVNSLFGLYNQSELPENFNFPTVHVYCFAKGENYLDITKELLHSHVDRNIGDKILNIFKVRTVSSLKEMMRVSFKLDKELLLQNSKRTQEDTDNSSRKKCNHGQEENDKEYI